jgi:hypothetical protein
VTAGRDREALSQLAYLLSWAYEGAQHAPDGIAWPGPGRQGVLRVVESLDDVAANLSPQLMSRHPRMEWTSFAAARRCLTMGFRHLDYGLLERIVDQFMDALEEMLDAELDDDEAE